MATSILEAISTGRSLAEQLSFIENGLQRGISCEGNPTESIDNYCSRLKTFKSCKQFPEERLIALEFQILQLWLNWLESRKLLMSINDGGPAQEARLEDLHLALSAALKYKPVCINPTDKRFIQYVAALSAYADWQLKTYCKVAPQFDSVGETQVSTVLDGIKSRLQLCQKIGVVANRLEILQRLASTTVPRVHLRFAQILLDEDLPASIAREKEAASLKKAIVRDELSDLMPSEYKNDIEQSLRRAAGLAGKNRRIHAMIRSMRKQLADLLNK